MARLPVRPHCAPAWSTRLPPDTGQPAGSEPLRLCPLMAIALSVMPQMPLDGVQQTIPGKGLDQVLVGADNAATCPVEQAVFAR